MIHDQVLCWSGLQWILQTLCMKPFQGATETLFYTLAEFTNLRTIMFLGGGDGGRGESEILEEIHVDMMRMWNSL